MSDEGTYLGDHFPLDAPNVIRTYKERMESNVHGSEWVIGRFIDSTR
jgi:hypothetical protein